MRIHKISTQLWPIYSVTFAALHTGAFAQTVRKPTTAPVARQTAQQSQTSVSFLTSPPGTFDYSGAYKIEPQTEKYARGTSFRRSWTFKGPGGEMVYSTQAKDNKLTIDISGSLDDSLLNAKQYRGNIYEYLTWNTGEPYFFLSNDQTVNVTIDFDLKLDTQTTVQVPTDNNTSSSGGGSSRLMMLSASNHVPYNRDDNGTTKTQPTSAVFKKTISGKASSIYWRSSPEPDKFGLITGNYGGFFEENGTKYNFKVSLPEFANRYFRNHREIQSEPPTNNGVYWNSDMVGLKSDPSRLSIFKTQIKGRIEVTVEPIYPVLSADYDLSKEVGAGTINRCFRDAHGDEDHFWFQGPATGGHTYLAINSIGRTGVSAKQAMTILKKNIQAMFPLGAKGLDGPNIEKGHRFTVTRSQPLPSNVIVPINPTDYQFVFQTIPHQHILQGTVTFGIFQDKCGELWLFQQGRGPAGELAAQALLNYPTARGLWIGMADNLKTYLKATTA